MLRSVNTEPNICDTHTAVLNSQVPKRYLNSYRTTVKPRTEITCRHGQPASPLKTLKMLNADEQ
jgi:hypothetical protein